MLEFLTALRGKPCGKHGAKQQYVALIRKAAADGLSAAEIDKLDTLCEHLSVSVEQIEADTNIVRRVAELAARGNGRHAANRAQKAAPSDSQFRRREQSTREGTAGKTHPAR